MHRVAKHSAGIYVSFLPVEDEFRHIGAMRELLGYARVSTTDQDAALQLDALNAADCYRVWGDTISGSLEHRRELTNFLISFARVTRSWCGESTGSVDRSGI
jgi:hypothetical protein